jgi:hypothetical protein
LASSVEAVAVLRNNAALKDGALELKEIEKINSLHGSKISIDRSEQSSSHAYLPAVYR